MVPQHLLGSGSYVSNTWRPTSAILRSKTAGIRRSPSAELSSLRQTSVRWEKDLRQNPDIDICFHRRNQLSLAPAKTARIWHDGYYPVSGEQELQMLYLNMVTTTLTMSTSTTLQQDVVIYVDNTIRID